MSEQSNAITQLPLGPDAAWRRYLERIRRAGDGDYERTELEAWEELQEALRRSPRAPTSAA